MPITGGCFCGAITYEINGPLHDARSCHCSRCRKAFSAQASAYAVVDPVQFAWRSGEALLHAYESQAGAGLMFCSQCGSTLCGIFNGIVHGVTLGCVDGDPEVVVTRHIYVGSKAAWEIMPAGVVQYDEGSPREGSPREGGPHDAIER
jgi:hypothetical protein